MNLASAKAEREKILSRMGEGELETDYVPASVCRCGKPLKHAGPCPGFKRAPRAVAQPLAQTKPANAIAQPVPIIATALVTQSQCLWAIKFEEGDDKIDMAGRGRARFDQVIKALNALIS